MTEVLISSLLIYYLSFDVGLLASLKFHAFIYSYFQPSYIYIYIYIYTYTEQIYKCNTFVFEPIFHELNSKI